MKYINRCSIFFLISTVFFFSFSKNGLANKTLVSLEITVHDSNVQYLKIPEFSIWVKEPNGWSHSDILKLNRYGQGHKRFYHNSKVDFKLQYYGYTIVDTTIYTKTFGIINLHFDLYKRPVEFSKAIAEQDIKNNHPHLVIFDEEIYRADKRLHFTKPFGFTYILRENPKTAHHNRIDDQFAIDHYIAYNTTTLNYLNSHIPKFKEKLTNALDSCLNFDADQRGRQNPIDCASLHITNKHSDEPRAETQNENSVQNNQPYIVRQGGLKMYEAFIALTNNMSVEEFKYTLQNDSDVLTILDLITCAANHYDTLVPYLICQLDNSKFVGLKNINAISRTIHHKNGFSEAEYLPPNFFLSGSYVGTVAGRAEFILSIISDKHFGLITANANATALEKLQNRWIYWLYKAIQRDKGNTAGKQKQG